MKAQMEFVKVTKLANVHRLCRPGCLMDLHRRAYHPYPVFPKTYVWFCFALLNVIKVWKWPERKKTQPFHTATSSENVIIWITLQEKRTIRLGRDRRIWRTLKRESTKHYTIHYSSLNVMFLHQSLISDGTNWICYHLLILFFFTTSATGNIWEICLKPGGIVRWNPTKFNLFFFK